MKKTKLVLTAALVLALQAALLLLQEAQLLLQQTAQAHQATSNISSFLSGSPLVGESFFCF